MKVDAEATDRTSHYTYNKRGGHKGQLVCKWKYVLAKS